MKLLLTTTIVVVGMMSQPFTKAAIFSFDSSSAAGWTASGGGAVNATPYVVANFGNYSPVLSVSSDGTQFGSFLSGGSVAQFDGFWTADYTFSLPANAVNVQFDFSKFFCDGRGVLKLNGNIISSAGFPTGTGSLNGFMVFTDGGAAQPYTFNGPFGNVAGSANSGFVLGGLNTIEVVVNNTPDNCAGTMVGLNNLDGTGFGIQGAVSYAVPEPGVAVLGLLGIGTAIASRRKQSR